MTSLDTIIAVNKKYVLMFNTAYSPALFAEVLYTEEGVSQHYSDHRGN